MEAQAAGKRRRRSARVMAEEQARMEEEARKSALAPASYSEEEDMPCAKKQALGKDADRTRRLVSGKAWHNPPTHEQIMTQQILDALESTSFVGTRWALHQLSMLSGSNATIKEIKVQSCPDILAALISIIMDWLRRPASDLTHADETATKEKARRTVAATQIIRNLSIKGVNLDTMSQFDYLVPTIVALANDLPPLEFIDGTNLHARATRDDTQLTFASAHAPSFVGAAHPVWENVISTLANLSPALHVDAAGGSHVCLPVLLRALWANHKIIASHAAYTFQHLSMADYNISVLNTTLPDLLEKISVLLHHGQMKHADIRCMVIQTLRNLSFDEEARNKVSSQSNMSARWNFKLPLCCWLTLRNVKFKLPACVEDCAHGEPAASRHQLLGHGRARACSDTRSRLVWHSVQRSSRATW